MFRVIIFLEYLPIWIIIQLVRVNIRLECQNIVVLLHNNSDRKVPRAETTPQTCNLRVFLSRFYCLGIRLHQRYTLPPANQIDYHLIPIFTFVDFYPVNWFTLWSLCKQRNSLSNRVFFLIFRLFPMISRCLPDPSFLTLVHPL